LLRKKCSDIYVGGREKEMKEDWKIFSKIYGLVMHYYMTFILLMFKCSTH